jgi:hypothetical protein
MSNTVATPSSTGATRVNGVTWAHADERHPDSPGENFYPLLLGLGLYKAKDKNGKAALATAFRP